MMLSVVVPTIAGREAELERTIRVYETLTGEPIEWIVERDHPTCGAAWNAGAARATGDVLHVTADDIEPETDAWLPAALAIIERGGAPVGWVREGWGTFGRDFCRLPTCRRDWWRDVPADLHYYTDNHFTDSMVTLGHPPMVAAGFDFHHRKSMVGRGAGMSESERVQHDRARYQAGRA